MNDRASMNLSASEFIQTEMIFSQKDTETSERCLASFPKNSKMDREFIKWVGKRRHTLGSLGQDVVLTLPNIPLRVRLDPVLSDDLVYYLAVGDYERSDLDLIQQFVRPGDRTMDIGAGIGICAARMAQCSGLPVIFVEARKELAPMIFDTLKLNDASGTFVNCAVCDDVPDKDTVSFTVSDNLWYSSLSSNTVGTVIHVPSRTLESIYDEYKPDCVLMDIEGAESTLNFNTKHHPRELLIEIHTPSIGSVETCHVIQKIIDSGYRLRDVSSQTWWFSSTRT